MTGTNRPALLCATITIGSSWGSCSTASLTLPTTRGQNGGSSEFVTSTSDGVAVTAPRDASLAATGAQLRGPSSKLCTSTNAGATSEVSPTSTTGGYANGGTCSRPAAGTSLK